MTGILLAQSDFVYRSRRYQENTNQYFYRPYASLDLRLGVENERYSFIVYIKTHGQSPDLVGAVERRYAGRTSEAFPCFSSTFAPDKRQLGLRARMNF